MAGWLALPCVLLGSYWWLVHAAMQMPSVQGVGLALVTWIAWHHARTGRIPALALTAASGALTAWVHPLCGAFALGAIGVHGALAPMLARKGPGAGAEARTLLLRAAGVAIAGAALASPATLIALRGPVLNAAPRHWFAPELHDPRFALHAHAPLVWIAGVAGLTLAWRGWLSDGWLVAWFVLGAAGTLAGYAGHDLGWPVPWLIPHEFQWHAQLALTLAATLAIVRGSEYAARKWRVGDLGRMASAAALAALTVGPGVSRLAVANSYVLVLDERWQGLITTARTIRQQTGPDAVIAAPLEASYFIAAFTGLRAVALPPGHANPAADADARMMDAESLLTTRDPARFVSLCSRYGVSCVLHPASDPEPPRGEAAIAAGWPATEPLALPPSAWRAYRVRLDEREGTRR